MKLTMHTEKFITAKPLARILNGRIYVCAFNIGIFEMGGVSIPQSYMQPKGESTGGTFQCKCFNPGKLYAITHGNVVETKEDKNERNISFEIGATLVQLQDPRFGPHSPLAAAVLPRSWYSAAVIVQMAKAVNKSMIKIHIPLV